MNLNFILFMSCISAIMAATASTFHRTKRQTNQDTPCRMPDGTLGICVPFSQSNGTHVLPGGFIDESVVRSSSSLQTCASGMWCSKLDLVYLAQANRGRTGPEPAPSSSPSPVPPLVPSSSQSPVPSATQSPVPSATQSPVPSSPSPPPVSSSSSPPLPLPKCTTMTSDVCPWCVTLHKVFDKTTVDKEAFCIGSLISSNVILTAATCMIASEKFTVFARVPTSANKAKNYYEKSRIYNPAYSSGTHFNDFGLIILEENVDWGTGGMRVACLGFEEMKGECLTFGLDKADNIVSTLIEPQEEPCKEMGGTDSLEATCGKNKDLNCFVSYGAPVVCQTKKSANGAELVGVVRSDCIKDEVLLGKLLGSIQWLYNILPMININIRTLTAS